MPTNINTVTNYFTTAYENSVAMTLNGTILAGAATVGISGMTNYTDGQIVTFTVDPATPSLKQVFTGTKNGSNVINVIWTEVPTGGSNVGHSAGATVIDYVTASHWDMLTTGILKSLNQNGSLQTTAVQTALNITGGAVGGWTPSGFAPTSVTALGNRSYSVVFNAHDLTPQISNGMRLQMTRTVTAPTQCTSLNGTTQFYSKTSPAGMTFTNFGVNSWWIKLNSYNGAIQTIASRYNGTSGWTFTVNTSGQLVQTGFNAGAANFNSVTSFQSVPLNKWIHVACEHDMSTGTLDGTHSWIMIDGVDVPAFKSTGGTNPTALIQAGNLEVGSQNGGLLPLNGKIANGGIFGAAVTETIIRSYMTQSLLGTETSLISTYTFNNSINDLNANANNLTANGSAVATNADTPFTQTLTLTGYTNGTTNFGIVTSTSFSTNTTLTVQVPEGDTIPTSGGVSAVSYATQKVPYGFPGQEGKWYIETDLRAGQFLQSTPVQNTWYNLTTTSGVAGGSVLNVPIGEWLVGYDATAQIIGTTNTIMWTTLSTGISSETDSDYSERFGQASAATVLSKVGKTKPQSVVVATPYYLNSKTDQTGVNSISTMGTIGALGGNTIIRAKNAYL